MKKVRWGILSTAKIGIEKVIPAMQNGHYCDVSAISSRDFNRAQKMAEELDIDKAYGSYEELLQDPEIDAVYNPLPNHLHVAWSIKALAAGKHILCEKPIALSVAEAEELLHMSQKHPHLKAMEAFMYRYHPQWLKSREIVDSGGIGRLCTIQSLFSYYNDDPTNVRNIVDTGGGGLMDIGCYNISLSRFIFNTEPLRAIGIIEHDPTFKTDRLTSGVLDFDIGTATFTCSTQLGYYQRVNIMGTAGRIEIEIPFNAPPDRPCRIWHQKDSEISEIKFDVCDQYTIQGDLFAQAVLEDSQVPTPLSDAVNNMKVIEAVRKSASENCWIAVK
jgi:predicted dehydrogenase